MVDDQLPGGCALIPLAVRGDERGSLVAIEQCRDVPFEMSRVYYLFGTEPGVTRGLHAHRQLQQLAIPVAGSCTMLLDDGTERRTIRLDDPAKGLLIRPMVWREMTDFSADCVLMVVADAPYDEADYIRDYEEFLTFAGQAQP